VPDICKHSLLFFVFSGDPTSLLTTKYLGPMCDHVLTLMTSRYALAADIQTIPGLPTAPGYLNVDIDTETGEIDGLF
jgi:hypothetical protein